MMMMMVMTVMIVIIVSIAIITSSTIIVIIVIQRNVFQQYFLGVRAREGPPNEKYSGVRKVGHISRCPGKFNFTSKMLNTPTSWGLQGATTRRIP